MLNGHLLVSGPNYPEMTDEIVEYVVEKVKGFIGKKQ